MYLTEKGPNTYVTTRGGRTGVPKKKKKKKKKKKRR
jgi:hypothetical protein